jgi:hypothetical protein
LPFCKTRLMQAPRVRRSRGQRPFPPRPTRVQAPMRFRPFWRRRFSTRRPPLVLMRTRKPWVLLRRRLLGWNVLFMNFLPHSPEGPRRGALLGQRIRIRTPPDSVNSRGFSGPRRGPRSLSWTRGLC